MNALIGVADLRRGLDISCRLEILFRSFRQVKTYATTEASALDAALTAVDAAEATLGARVPLAAPVGRAIAVPLETAVTETGTAELALIALVKPEGTAAPASAVNAAAVTVMLEMPSVVSYKLTTPRLLDGAGSAAALVPLAWL